ncbi:MAG: TetR/AcrR family transcriptional regulator [Pseudomonadota bacterium]|nr:TetR/AcrR family transcriptional regulator [Pseudomonadota bacterium]
MTEPHADPAPARRKNDPQGMRGRVLDAAAALFQGQGYYATTTQQIAATAEVTHGAMHHHFATKKALGLAVIRERVADAIRETWIEPMSNGDTALDAVGMIFDDIATGLDQRGRVEGCPLNNMTLELALGDHDFRDEVQPIFDRWRAAIATRVQRDRQGGRSRTLDPDAFATHVVAACSGAMAMGKASQTSDAVRVIARQIEATYRPAGRHS